MIKHIVAWNIKQDAPQDAAQQIKTALESLAGKIDGLIEIKVQTNLVAGSNRQILLDSLFESEEALAVYQAHPLHVAAAQIVGTLAYDRICLDWHC